MSWQDVTFAAGSVIMSIALLPAVRSAHKPPPSTCLGYLVILLTFAAAYASLQLWLAAATTAGNALVWAIMVGQAAARCRSRTRPPTVHEATVPPPATSEERGRRVRGPAEAANPRG